MIDVKEEILDYLVKNRDTLKEILRPIQLRRNAMYERDSTEHWQEINDSYSTALFVQIYDELSQRMDLPIDELYITLNSMNLSGFFEPSN